MDDDVDGYGYDFSGKPRQETHCFHSSTINDSFFFFFFRRRQIIVYMDKDKVVCCFNAVVRLSTP
jgi:hypothetical protein